MDTVDVATLVNVLEQLVPADGSPGSSEDAMHFVHDLLFGARNLFEVHAAGLITTEEFANGLVDRFHTWKVSRLYGRDGDLLAPIDATRAARVSQTLQDMLSPIEVEGARPTPLP